MRRTMPIMTAMVGRVVGRLRRAEAGPAQAGMAGGQTPVTNVTHGSGSGSGSGNGSAAASGHRRGSERGTVACRPHVGTASRALAGTTNGTAMTHGTGIGRTHAIGGTGLGRCVPAWMAWGHGAACHGQAGKDAVVPCIGWRAGWLHWPDFSRCGGMAVLCCGFWCAARPHSFQCPLPFFSMHPASRVGRCTPPHAWMSRCSAGALCLTACTACMQG